METKVPAVWLVGGLLILGTYAMVSTFTSALFGGSGDTGASWVWFLILVLLVWWTVWQWLPRPMPLPPSEPVKRRPPPPVRAAPALSFRKQVFHVPGNHYTFDDAQAVCKAYGADLATYDQVETAYNRGGEWCSYGWTLGQMALFPTQPRTYDRLQHVKGHEHDCGRPGVNGGYVANDRAKFGVNCYGYKPAITPDEEEMMRDTRDIVEAEDPAFRAKVDRIRRRLDRMFLAPFNREKWSEWTLTRGA